MYEAHRITPYPRMRRLVQDAGWMARRGVCRLPEMAYNAHGAQRLDPEEAALRRS